MKFKELLILLVLLLLLSSCSSSTGGSLNSIFGGGSSSSSSSVTQKEDLTGKGLEFTFNLDDKWIDIRRVDYELTLENTGKKNVNLQRSRVKLITEDRLTDANSYVFTSDSLNTFYTNLFTNGNDIVLVQNQKLSKPITGSLFIEPDFFLNLAKNSVKYTLSFEYDYQTEFKNNVQLDFRAGSKTWLKVTDTLSQAAPVEITNIELTPSSVNQGNVYSIVYTIKETGPADSENTVEIKDLKLVFSNQDLSDCRYFTHAGSTLKEIQRDNLKITKTQKDILVVCNYDMSQFVSQEFSSSVTSGSFSYVYEVSKTGTIRLPKDRNKEIFVQ